MHQFGRPAAEGTERRPRAHVRIESHRSSMHQVKLAAAIAILIATGCQPQSEPSAVTRTTTPLMAPPGVPAWFLRIPTSTGIGAPIPARATARNARCRRLHPLSSQREKGSCTSSPSSCSPSRPSFFAGWLATCRVGVRHRHLYIRVLAILGKPARNDRIHARPATGLCADNTIESAALIIVAPEAVASPTGCVAPGKRPSRERS
jgi:hypothetical protein